MTAVNPLVDNLDGHTTWFRLADPSWTSPLDTSHAESNGGRWNSPGSHATLYLCADVATAAAQIARLLQGTFLVEEDLRDDAYLLVPVTLPRGLSAADAHSERGLQALGLPTTYPHTATGAVVSHTRCQPIGDEVARQGLGGVHACSATPGAHPHHRELAWFPKPGERATASDPLPYLTWRHAH